MSALWTACLVLTFTFPRLKHPAGIGATCWVCAATCPAGFFCARAKAPEITGRSLDLVARELGL